MPRFMSLRPESCAESIRALLLGGLILAGSPQASSAAQTAGEATPDSDVALVTGSTDGLGREVAKRLAAMGTHVIVHGRSIERGQALVAEIEAEGRGSASFYPADLSSFAQTRELALAILQDYDRLDVLVNNAGIWLDPDLGRQLSTDGHELHFQVNYLSGFLLARMLLPLIIESSPSRIVNVASIAQTPIDFSDVMLESGYSDSRAYAQSKLAQILFTVDLADELSNTDVKVTALHPATFMDTDMVLSRGATPRSSVHDGAEAVMHLITSEDVPSGQYFNGTSPARANEQAYDEAARRHLRALSLELTGLD